MRYFNAISYAILLVIAYDIKDIANAIKKISHEISLRYRNDAISHAISHLSRIQMVTMIGPAGNGPANDYGFPDYGVPERSDPGTP